ncbi:MAG: SDR family NAD(P)-dependent oxidoreductase [Candidatus Accumulibacter sp.]|jgi:NAD(P)-dependent dehydrogenase (short-subunit alcohol dehydrogenase family)|nr:SDR family NAD(P)-dependent oxidoreductase [Accumulibacter sp.]
MSHDADEKHGASMRRRKILALGAELGLGVAAGSILSSPVLAQTPSTPQEQASPARPRRDQGKGRIFITGSSGGLGYAAAKTLLAEGYGVVVHVRSGARRAAVADLAGQGAIVTIGDLSDAGETRNLADQVNKIGQIDAVIHNAGVASGPQVLVVNVVAPYLLTALIQGPRRLIYLSSGMHTGGRANLAGMDWTGQRVTGSYSDSKLFVTALCAAVARRRPEVFSNAVNPGWVPTRMGGPNAPDDLRLGHLTQEWLATSDAPEALTSGGYWYHQRRVEPHPAVHDTDFQNRLLAELARATDTPLA